MWQFQEFIQQPKLVHHLHSGGVDGVAAKIAQEIGMFLEDHHINAGARQQEAEHHAGRPSTSDATGRIDGVLHESECRTGGSSAQFAASMAEEPPPTGQLSTLKCFVLFVATHNKSPLSAPSDASAGSNRRSVLLTIGQSAFSLAACHLRSRNSSQNARCGRTRSCHWCRTRSSA